MHIFISKLSHKSPSIQIQEKWPKIPKSSSTGENFHRGWIKGYSSLWIAYSHSPTSKSNHSELGSSPRNSSRIQGPSLLFYPSYYYSVRYRILSESPFWLPSFFLDHLEVFIFVYSWLSVSSILCSLVFSVVCYLKQNHIGFPLKTLSLLA